MSIAGPDDATERRSGRSAWDRIAPFVVAAFVLLAFVFVGGGGWYLLRHDPAGAQLPACVAPSTARPLSAPVRVLNATDRSGLARRTAGSLAARGFHLSGVGNTGRRVAGVAQIRYPPAAAATARTLALHVPGAALAVDRKLHNEVELTLGAKFRALRSTAGVAALQKRHASPRAARPSPTATSCSARSS